MKKIIKPSKRISGLYKYFYSIKRSIHKYSIDKVANILDDMKYNDSRFEKDDSTHIDKYGKQRAILGSGFDIEVRYVFLKTNNIDIATLDEWGDEQGDTFFISIITEFSKTIFLKTKAISFEQDKVQ